MKKRRSPESGPLAIEETFSQLGYLLGTHFAWHIAAESSGAQPRHRRTPAPRAQAAPAQAAPKAQRVATPPARKAPSTRRAKVSSRRPPVEAEPAAEALERFNHILRAVESVHASGDTLVPAEADKQREMTTLVQGFLQGRARRRSSPQVQVRELAAQLALALQGPSLADAFAEAYEGLAQRLLVASEGKPPAQAVPPMVRRAQAVQPPPIDDSPLARMLREAAR